VRLLYSRINTLLDPTTLGGVVGEVSGLDQDLAVLELGKVLLDKLESVLIRHVGRGVGKNPCAGSLRGRHFECVVFGRVVGQRGEGRMRVQRQGDHCGA